MSTAGKVLSVIILLSVIVWTVLAAGVAQVNYSGNSQLEKLQKDVANLKEDITKNRDEFATLRDQTTLMQEKLDLDYFTLSAKQNDVERTRSQIFDTLSALKYQLETVEATIKSAQATFEHRKTEAAEEEKGLADARERVKTLDRENGQMLAKLQSLRDQFKATYRNNLGMVGTRQ